MRKAWKEISLGDLCALEKGSSPTQKTPPGKYPLIVTGPNPLSSATYQFDGEAVCVPMVSSTGHGHASMKRVHFATGRFAVANIVTACSVIDVSECDTRYLWLYLQHKKDELIVSRMKGTANVSLSQKELAKVPVLLPPLPEQRRIVDLIGSLDEAIEAAEEHLSSTQAVLVALQQRLPQSPEVMLSEIIVAIESGVSVSTDGAPSSQGPRILKVSAVHPGRYQPWESKPVPAGVLPGRALVNDGDLLMTRSNTPDRVGYVCVAREVAPETYLPDLIWRLRPDESQVLPDYLEHAMSSPLMRSRITATASGTSQSMKKVNKAGTYGLRIPLPSIPEQQSYLVPILAASDVVLEASALVDTLRTLRSEILAACLSGVHEIPESYDDQISDTTTASLGAAA